MKMGRMGRMKKGEGEGRKGGTSTTAYPRRCRPICLLLPMSTATTATSACGCCDGVQVLRVDNASGTWCGFAPS